MNNENVYPAPKRVPPGTVVQVDGKDYMVVWSSFDAAYVQLAKITEDNALPPTTKPALAESAPAEGPEMITDGSFIHAFVHSDAECNICRTERAKRVKQ